MQRATRFPLPVECDVIGAGVFPGQQRQDSIGPAWPGWRVVLKQKAEKNSGGRPLESGLVDVCDTRL